MTLGLVIDASTRLLGPLLAIASIMVMTAVAEPVPALAALVGGDIGPRLLPIGSLAGLLWLSGLRRQGADVGPGLFLKVGVLAAVPTLIVAVLILGLY